ncbi:hypothetical protein H9L39_10073 [Fusarium oxysporum f. sp. albedinis]|nr:hypothetical protein H9L39_10073 [Fusarium oxysporum f. sp. albedinis]
MQDPAYQSGPQPLFPSSTLHMPHVVKTAKKEKASNSLHPRKKLLLSRKWLIVTVSYMTEFTVQQKLKIRHSHSRNNV